MVKDNLNAKKPGYILIITLMTISILIISVTRVFYRSTSYSAFSNVMLNSQKAKQLALSGLQLAISQLQGPRQAEEKEENKEQSSQEKNSENQDEQKKYFLKRILPALNLWQKIPTKEDDGLIEYCISCENGKFNINKIYLANQELLKKEDKKKIEQLDKFFNRLSEFVNSDGNIFAALQTFFSELKYPLNDVTELLKVDQLKYFKNYVFYEPGDEEDSGKQKLYLMDLFTIWTGSFQLEPWLLSHSVQTFFGLKSPNSVKKRAEVVDGWLKNFKSNVNWSESWNTMLQPVYEKEFGNLPEGMANMFFDQKFDPTVFSVMSKGRVGEVVKKVYAILKVNLLGKNNISYKIIKLYWV